MVTLQVTRILPVTISVLRLAGDVVHRDRLVTTGPALRADQRVETVGVGARVGVRYDLPAGAVVGGVGHPPQNLVNRKWHFQFDQQFFIAEFLHGREVSFGIEGVRGQSQRMSWVGSEGQRLKMECRCQ